MNNEKLEPRLRFPEFKNIESWSQRRFFDVLFEHKLKSTGKEEVFSVSVHKGVINQIEHLGRVFAASNTEKYKLVKPGDLIYTKSPTGDFPFGIIKQSKISKSVIVSPLYGVFTPETYALGVILDAYFESPENTVNYLSSIIQKGAKNTINISNDTFLSKSLVLPSNKNEQQKIASCLSSLDEVIAAQHQKVELLKAHKKGLMQQLFPQEGERVPRFRFKEFEKDGEWEEKKLGEVAGKVGSGVTPLGGDSNYKKVGRPFVRSQNVGWGTLLIENIVYIDESVHFNSSNTEIKMDDVLLNITGASIGRCAVANEFVTGGNVNQHVCIIRTEKNKLNPFYLNQFIISDSGQKQINGFQAGGNRQGLNFVQIRSFSLPLPPKIEEQQKIASCLSSLDALIAAQLEKLEQFKLHKKGLMQGLFPSGKE